MEVAVQKCNVVQEKDAGCQEGKYCLGARIDGYQIATIRANRKKQATISVKLFKGHIKEYTEVGRLMFYRKKLPDDFIGCSDGEEIIMLHALLGDFDRMMRLIKDDCNPRIEFLGKSAKEGRAYLKSAFLVFPPRP